MQVPGLLVVGAVFCPHPFLLISLEGFLQRGRILDADGVLEGLVGSSLLLLVFLRLDFLAGHFLWPYEGLVFPSGKAPDGQGWQDDRQQQVFGTEEPLAVHEQGIEEYLDAVVERYAGREEEQQHRLHDAERAPFLYALAREVERADQYHHRWAEMIGHREAHHHVAEREQQSREQRAVKAVQSDDFPQDAV